MSEDLIKRSDAIKDLCDISNNSDMPNDWHRGMSVAISALYRVPPVPPADRPQGEWIPCSERLPQYRDVVLISTFWGVRVAERDGIKEDGTDDFWYLFLNDATAHPRYVYAWMPLPKPWKGADDDSDNI